MARARTVFLVGLALVILAPERARAAGTITGISAAPNPAQVNQNVTVTLQGNGGCGSVIVNFGDNQTQTLNDVDFSDNSNTSAGPHKYAQAATYTVTANPGSGCQGTATTTLTVKSGGVYHFDAFKTLAYLLLPQITKQFWVVTPGSSILIGGKNFGTTPGKVHLQGQFGTRDLVNLEWYPTGIGAKIPTTISGVGDHPATLQVRTSAGALTNQYPRRFRRATRGQAASPERREAHLLQRRFERGRLQRMDRSRRLVRGIHRLRSRREHLGIPLQLLGLLRR